MSTHEIKAEKAARLGLIVVTPTERELFVDIDDESSAETFWTVAPILHADGLIADFAHGTVRS